MRAPCLEEELHPELHLTHGADDARDATRLKQVDSRVRLRVVLLIEHVECLESYLNLAARARPTRPEPLEETEVGIEEPGANQDVASGVAEVERDRRRERRRIEPAVGRTLSARQVAVAEPV